MAKTQFPSAVHAVPVPRGNSARPLSVTAAEVPLDGAARLVRAMAGFHATVWKPATITTGLPVLRFHDLRHTAGTLATAADDLREVTDRLGHSSAAAIRVALCATWCDRSRMNRQPEITQRDLRMRSREIMDAVEHGQAFIVTRNGHHIGELIPPRRRHGFVPKAEFVAMSRSAPALDLEAFRADQDVTADHDVGSVYEP